MNFLEVTQVGTGVKTLVYVKNIKYIENHNDTVYIALGIKFSKKRKMSDGLLVNESYNEIKRQLSEGTKKPSEWNPLRVENKEV